MTGKQIRDVMRSFSSERDSSQLILKTCSRLPSSHCGVSPTISEPWPNAKRSRVGDKQKCTAFSQSSSEVMEWNDNEMGNSPL